MWINKILSWLFFANVSQQKNSAKNMAIKFLFVSIFGIAFTWNTFGKLEYPMLPDGHASLSLEMALNWKMCSKFSSATQKNGVSIQTMMWNNKEILNQPLSVLPVKLSGSIEAYCSQPFNPFVNNENSLMFLDWAILSLNSDLTMNQLGAWLSGLRIAINLAFSAALLAIGLSPLFVLTSFVAVQNILSKIDITHLYSLYPNILPLCLGFALMVAWVASAYSTKKMLRILCASLALGFFAGFVGNMRSTYSLVCMAGIALLLFILNNKLSTKAAISKEGCKKELAGGIQIGARKKILALWIIVMGYFAGLYAFDSTLIDAIRKENSKYPVSNRTYHVVMHPLVLGLAIPENDFAKKQGIRWDDSVGPSLAHQVDPTAQYLDKNYEKALFVYYLKLWIYYPKEMVELYLEKWKSAASSMGYFFPAPSIQNGITLTIFFIGLLISIYLLLRQFSAASSILIMFPLLAALLCLGESTMVMSAFVPNYHSPILFGLIFGYLLIIQVIVNGLVVLFGKLPSLLFRNNIKQTNIESGVHQIGEKTIQDFGEQWTTFQDVSGFFGSKDLLADFLEPFDVANISNARMADIGAGTGRHVAACLEFGAKEVFAIEPSQAVGVIRKRFAADGRVSILNIRGDQIPADLNLDLIISIGVIHHIPDPHPVIRAAYNALRPGGTLVVWLYGYEGNRLYLAFVLPLRFLLRPFPLRIVYGISWLLDFPLRLYISACRVLSALPLAVYMTQILGRLPSDKRRLVIYDQLKPAYAKYYRKDEAIDLLRKAGFEVEAHHRKRYSWLVIGHKAEKT